MTTRYRVTVTEMGHEMKEVGGLWEKGAGPEGAYGYTPQHQALREFERDVFIQELESLDLPGLVRAINP